MLIKDNYGNTALMYAVHRDHAEIAKVLLQAGADVNAKNNNGWTALIFSFNKMQFSFMVEANPPYVESIKMFIEYGADVNVKDNAGRTVLDYAKEAGDYDIIQLLLKAGAVEK